MRLPLLSWRLLLVSVLAALALVALAACGDDDGGTATPGGESPAETPEGETPVAREGGVYQTGMFEDITTTNFWSFYGPDATVYNGYVYDCIAATLYRYSESRWDWVPALAVDVPSDLAQEGDLWTSTVALDSDASWSDGEPMTAEDAIFTWDTVRDLEIADGNWPSRVNLDFYDHAEAVEPSSLKIFFKDQPGLPIWQFGLGLAPILPKHYWEPVVEEAKASGDPVATLYAHDGSDAPGWGCNMAQREAGAFVENTSYLDNALQGTTVRQYADGAYQEENPDRPNRNFTLYGEATGDVELEFEFGPHSESTVYNVYADQDSALLAMQQGEFDFWLNPLSLPKGLADQLAATQGIEIISNPSNGFRYLGFNFRVAPMDDVAFRQAVAVLIDREFVSNEILQGQAVPVYGTVPEGNAFWYNPDVPKVGEGLTREERINQALEIMKAAGYTWDVEPAWDPDGAAVNPKGSGLKMPDGTAVSTLRLSAPSAGYDPLRSTFSLWIGTWLNEFGIPVDVQQFGFNLLAGKIFDEQDIDMWILGWGLTPFPDHLSAFFDCAQGELGGFNAGGFCNDDFQALIDAFNVETDVDAAKDLIFQMQGFLADDPPYVVLFTTPVVEAYRSSAVQFPYTAEVDGLQGVHVGLPYQVKIL